MKTKQTTKNTITIEYIDFKSKSEIDIDLYYEVLGRKDADEAYEEWGPHIIDTSPCYHNDPIKIDTLMKQLRQLKNSGANYVAIDYHCDHHEYNVEGYAIRRATDEDIAEEEKRVLAEKVEKANVLREEANRLIEQAQELIK